MSRRIIGLTTCAVALAGLAACDRGVATAQDGSEASAPAEAGSALDQLPLRRGYYVTDDATCDRASNADVLLLRRGGIGGSRDFCAFAAIERTGPNTYRVTEACADLQDEAPPETSVGTYTIPDDTSFTFESEYGWSRSARHCEQSSMSEPFRDNDIEDLIG